MLVAGQKILFDGFQLQLPPRWTGELSVESLTWGLLAQRKVHIAIWENIWQLLLFSEATP